ncbi:hypothetical protein N8508_00075 [bacterium]|nr:hypothetical protein [bacterium]
MPLSDRAKKQSRVFAIKWNSENPIDFLWRKAFSVAFGSKEHLEVDVIDQQIWFEESELIKELADNPNSTFDSEGRVIIHNEDGYGMSQDEIDKTFDDWDIGELNKKDNG